MEYDEDKRELVTINGQPLDVEKEYHIGLLALSLNGMNRNQPLIDWANENQSKMPRHDDLFMVNRVLCLWSVNRVWKCRS
jgi:hypothetical protein